MSSTDDRSPSDDFLQYAHVLLVARGADPHDAQGCCKRLHATPCLEHIEGPPVEVCAMFSALPGAGPQRTMACPQQVIAVGYLKH